MINEYPFKAGICCGFITPELDKHEFEFIAEYTYTPPERGYRDKHGQWEPDTEGELEIIRVRPAGDTVKLVKLAMALYMNEVGDFEHLENEILDYIESGEGIEPRASMYSEYGPEDLL